MVRRPLTPRWLTLCALGLLVVLVLSGVVHAVVVDGDGQVVQSGLSFSSSSFSKSDLGGKKFDVSDSTGSVAQVELLNSLASNTFTDCTGTSCVVSVKVTPSQNFKLKDKDGLFPSGFVQKALLGNAVIPSRVAFLGVLVEQDVTSPVFEWQLQDVSVPLPAGGTVVQKQFVRVQTGTSTTKQFVPLTDVKQFNAGVTYSLRYVFSRPAGFNYHDDLVFSFGYNFTEFAWWNTSFNYKIMSNTTAVGSGTLSPALGIFNASVTAQVAAGKMWANASDIAVTNGTESTQLPCYLTPNTANTANMVVFFKYAELYGGTTAENGDVLYYGNNDTVGNGCFNYQVFNQENLTAAFLVPTRGGLAPLNSTTLNALNASNFGGGTVGTGGSHGDYMNFTAANKTTGWGTNAGGSSFITGAAGQFDFRFRLNAGFNTGNNTYIIADNGTGWYNLVGNNDGVNNYLRWVTGANPCIGLATPLTVGQWYSVTLRWNASLVDMYVDGVQSCSTTNVAIGSVAAPISFGSTPAQNPPLMSMYGVFIHNYTTSDAWVKAYANMYGNISGVGAEQAFSAASTPSWQSNSTAPANGTAYSTGQYVSLNVSWTNVSTLSAIVFNVDGTNYSLSGADNTNYSTTTLAAGQHDWFVFANDTSGGSGNVTDTWTFNLSQATPTLTLHLNGSAANLNIRLGQQANLSCMSSSGYALTANFTVNGTVSQTGATPLTNNTVYTQQASYAERCATSGDANYTSNTSQTFILTAAELDYASNATSPANGTTWSSGLYVSFNASWTDILGVDTIKYLVDGTNYTVKNGSLTKGNYSTTTLAAGYHSWQACANDTLGFANCTPLTGFNLVQASPNVTVHAQTASSNYLAYAGESVNVTVLSIDTSYAVTVTLYKNGTNVTSSNALPVYTNTVDSGVTYNFSGCFTGDANYTSACTERDVTWALQLQGGGGGGSGDAPVRSETQIVLADGKLVTPGASDLAGEFKAWVKGSTDFNGLQFPNWLFVLLAIAVGVAYGTSDNKLTPLGQASVAFGLLATITFFM